MVPENVVAPSLFSVVDFEADRGVGRNSRNVDGVADDGLVAYLRNGDEVLEVELVEFHQVEVSLGSCLADVFGDLRVFVGRDVFDGVVLCRIVHVVSFFSYYIDLKMKNVK